MDFSLIYQHAIESTILVLNAAVIIGIAYLRTWVNQKIKQEEFKNSLIVTLDSIETATKKSIVNLGSAVKEAIKDGTVSKSELENLRTTALRDIHENLTPMIKRRLQAHIGDVDKYLQDKVTTTVEDILQNALQNTPQSLPYGFK